MNKRGEKKNNRHKQGRQKRRDHIRLILNGVELERVKAFNLLRMKTLHGALIGSTE